MKKVTNKEIADLIGKSEQTVRGWGVKFPNLYKLVKLGSYCYFNNITFNDLENLNKFKSSINKDKEAFL